MITRHQSCNNRYLSQKWRQYGVLPTGKIVLLLRNTKYGGYIISYYIVIELEWWFLIFDQVINMESKSSHALYIILGAC
jgi:hypothetical protein